MEWQPIETAPKDGTRILLFTSRANIPCVAYRKKHPNGEEFSQWEPDSSFLYADGDRATIERDLWDSDVTHWMPLPEPPK